MSVKNGLLFSSISSYYGDTVGIRILYVSGNRLFQSGLDAKILGIQTVC